MISQTKPKELKLKISNSPIKNLLQRPLVNFRNVIPISMRSSNHSSQSVRERNSSVPKNPSLLISPINHRHRKLKISANENYPKTVPNFGKNIEIDPKFTYFANTVVNAKLAQQMKTNSMGFYSSRNSIQSCSASKTGSPKESNKKAIKIPKDGSERAKIIEEHLKMKTISNPSVCLLGIQQKLLERKASMESQKDSKVVLEMDKVSLKILLSNKINVNSLMSTIRTMRKSVDVRREKTNCANLARLARINGEFVKLMPKHIKEKVKNVGI